ncbi:hypothetical protein WA158_006865 [Blastocystis sp. Blastoise]
MSTYYDYTAAGDGCCFVENITDDFHNNEVISRLCCLDPQGNTDFQKWGSSKETGFVESELNDYDLPDILDVLFQQCLNTETLRLSLSLFFNIYLTNKNIDIFYEAAHNNRIYESIQATTIICQLLPLFPNQQREYLQSLLLNTCDNICTVQSIKKTVGEYIFR